MSPTQPSGGAEPLDTGAHLGGEASAAPAPLAWPLHDEAELNKDRLELALEAAGLDLWENDLVTGAVTRQATKTFTELGYTPEEMASQMLDLYGLFHPDDVDGVRQAVQDHLGGVTPQYRCEFRLRSKQGAWVWFANYGRIMDTHTATPGRRLIGVTFNIDDRKRREQEIADINQQLREQNALLQQLNETLEGLASKDPLTGLCNRRTLMQLGEAECRRAERFGHPLSVLVVDIDFFKSVNDAWGHLVGDRMICAVAEVFQARKRSGVDIVARFGGEEFVIVLPETDGAGALQAAESFRSEVAAMGVPVNEQGLRLSVTVSVGVATSLPGEPMLFETLVNRADHALYQAKGTGRNAVYSADGNNLPLFAIE
jgi:diguanylate cyclase (GGDEF)-like protein/PAS domain S-box-containing protein